MAVGVYMERIDDGYQRTEEPALSHDDWIGLSRKDKYRELRVVLAGLNLSNLDIESVVAFVQSKPA